MKINNYIKKRLLFSAALAHKQSEIADNRKLCHINIYSELYSGKINGIKKIKFCYDHGIQMVCFLKNKPKSYSEIEELDDYYQSICQDENSIFKNFVVSLGLSGCLTINQSFKSIGNVNIMDVVDVVLNKINPPAPAPQNIIPITPKRSLFSIKKRYLFVATYEIIAQEIWEKREEAGLNKAIVNHPMKKYVYGKESALSKNIYKKDEYKFSNKKSNVDWSVFYSAQNNGVVFLINNLRSVKMPELIYSLSVNFVNEIAYMQVVGSDALEIFLKLQATDQAIKSLISYIENV